MTHFILSAARTRVQKQNLIYECLLSCRCLPATNPLTLSICRTQGWVWLLIHSALSIFSISIFFCLYPLFFSIIVSFNLSIILSFSFSIFSLSLSPSCLFRTVFSSSHKDGTSRRLRSVPAACPLWPGPSPQAPHPSPGHTLPDAL